MQQIQMQQRFEASAEKVFAMITDHVAMGRWLQSEIQLERQGRPAPNGLGAVRTVKTRGFTVREEVVRWDAPRAMDYRVIGGAPLQNHLGEIRITPEGNGSRVDYRIRFELPWYLGGGLAGRVLASTLRKEIAAALVRMAAALR